MTKRILAVAILFAACATNAPAAKSPLKEKLAAMSDGDLEDATVRCLETTGWKVDHIPGRTGGLKRIRATTKDSELALYLHPAPDMPRITGLNNDDDPFWKCLEGTLNVADDAGTADASTD